MEEKTALLVLLRYASKRLLSAETEPERHSDICNVAVLLDFATKALYGAEAIDSESVDACAPGIHDFITGAIADLKPVSILAARIWPVDDDELRATFWKLHMQVVRPLRLATEDFIAKLEA